MDYLFSFRGKVLSETKGHLGRSGTGRKEDSNSRQWLRVAVKHILGKGRGLVAVDWIRLTTPLQTRQATFCMKRALGQILQ